MQNPNAVLLAKLRFLRQLGHLKLREGLPCPCLSAVGVTQALTAGMQEVRFLITCLDAFATYSDSLTALSVCSSSFGIVITLH